MRKTPIIAALASVGALMGIGGAAQAGEWRLDPRRCPDLREDIRDARVDHGWRDRAEDRRDRRVTNCPRSAWVYIPDRYERQRGYYQSAYRSGPPIYRGIRFSGSGYYGLIGTNSFRIAIYDHDRDYRYARRYDERYAYHQDRRDDHRDDRWDRRDDHRNDRRDHRSDRHDDRRDHHNDRHDRDDHDKGRHHDDNRGGKNKGKGRGH